MIEVMGKINLDLYLNTEKLIWMITVVKKSQLWQMF